MRRQWRSEPWCSGRARRVSDGLWHNGLAVFAANIAAAACSPRRRPNAQTDGGCLEPHFLHTIGALRAHALDGDDEEGGDDDGGGD